MSERRINPETGVKEERHWYGWDSVQNSDGREERVNPQTGVYEEQYWYGWESKPNGEGREERSNPDTGVREEGHWYGWNSTCNNDGREERTNPETGVHEQRCWYGWDSVRNEDKREERVNPETGVREERRWYGWDSHETSNRGLDGRPVHSAESQREQTSSAVDSSTDSQVSNAGVDHTRDGDDSEAANATGHSTCSLGAMELSRKRAKNPKPEEATLQDAILNMSLAALEGALQVTPGGFREPDVGKRDEMIRRRVIERYENVYALMGLKDEPTYGRYATKRLADLIRRNPELGLLKTLNQTTALLLSQNDPDGAQALVHARKIQEDCRKIDEVIQSEDKDFLWRISQDMNHPGACFALERYHKLSREEMTFGSMMRRGWRSLLGRPIRPLRTVAR